MGRWRNVFRRNEVVRQRILGLFLCLRVVWHRLRVDEPPQRQQLEREDVDFLFGLLAWPYHIPEVMMGKARFDAVTGVVRQRQRYRSGRGNRAVVGEACADLGELIDQLRRFQSDLLHIAAIAAMQNPPGNCVANLVAVFSHFGTSGQYFRRYLEFLIHNWRWPLLFGQLETRFPSCDCQLSRDFLGEVDGSFAAILHAQHRDRRTESQETHAMAPLAPDFIALQRKREAVDLYDIVEHPGEYLDDLSELFPVEPRLFGKWLQHELGQVNRAKQTGTVRRQRLLAAWIRRPNVLDEPIVVHLIDLIDQYKTRLREIIGRRHDDIPYTARRQTAIDLAGNQAIRITYIVVRPRPFPPHKQLFILHIEPVLLDLFLGHRKGEFPVFVISDSPHEFIGNQERQIELSQAAVFAFRADEIHDIRMPDIEGAHLCPSTPAGRRHGETHLVVDIHER